MRSYSVLEEHEATCLTAAAEIPVVCAAMGVDFFTLRNPSAPHEVLATNCPLWSVTLMSVLRDGQNKDISDRL